MGVSPAGKKFLTYQLPAILWAALIFASSATPEDAFPQFDLWWLPKLIHIIYFSTLCCLVYRALKHQDRFEGLARMSLPISLLITFLYAVSDETHQIFVPGRHPEASDVVLDTVSAMLWIGTMKLSTLWREFRETKP